MSVEKKHSGALQLSNTAKNKLTVLAALVFMCAFFAVMSPYFLTADNLLTIGVQAATNGILAYGMTMVIISQSIDLSMGSCVALSGVLTTLLLKAGLGLFPAVLTALLACLFIGAINGCTISFMQLPPFIATLGMQMAVRGITLVVTNAKPVYLDNRSFQLLAHGRIFNAVPYPILYLIFLALIAAFILRKTIVGRRIYAVGSNEAAAKLSGINTAGIRIFAHCFSGLMAGITGVILAARLNSGQPTIGVGFEGNAIAAAVIGGASMTGGHGSITGTVLGVLVLGVLMNGLNLVGVSQNWQTFATGVVLILAVYLDKARAARSGKK